MQTGGARMWLMAGVLAGLCGGGCYDEDPTGPRRLATPVAQVLVTADTACVRARFDLTGPTTVQTQFPERTDCAASLVLIRAQPAQWAQSPNRQLRVFVRILNTSGGAIQLPVRLYLSPTGTTVDVPSGTPGSKVVPLNADSTDAGGGKIWFLGGTSVLAVGDSTALDTLGFNVQSPVDQARWQFQATAMSITGAPPVPPAANLPSDSSVTVLATDSTRYYRDIVGIAFDDSTSDVTILSVFQQFEATVIGGYPNEGTRGAYLVRVPDPGPTLVELDSLRDAIAAHGGVTYVFPVAFRTRLDPRGRFPTDGPGGSRADWQSAGGGLDAWKAVRAPLAWGCETGMYGGGLARIGIADWSFDTASPEFSGSVLNLVLPAPADSVVTSAALVDPSPDPATGKTLGAVYRSHGTAVAAIATARGDNGIGIAGVLWRADLTLFAYGRGTTDELHDVVGYWVNTVLDSARKAGVQVLLTSNPPRGDTTATRRLEVAIGKYLAANAKNILVIANANHPFSLTIQQLATSTDARTTAFDRAAARAHATYPNQVIFVAGSDGQGAFFPNGSVWTGGTQVAAPAVNVRTFGRVADFPPDGILQRTGNSYAAPFIAGTLGAMYAMDSSLTAADAVAAMVAGTALARVDSITGASVQPAHLGGGPVGFRQLDVYSALSLLSRERPGTPICGSDVTIRGPAWVAPWIVFSRNGTNADSFRLARPNHDRTWTLAQGGRRVAATSLDINNRFEVLEYQLQGGTWTQVNALPGVQRRTYLESDTVDLLEDGRTFVLRGSGWGGSGTQLDFCNLVCPPGTDAGLSETWFSPTAGFAVVGFGHLCPDQITVVGEAYLVQLPGGPASTLMNLPCTPANEQRYAMDVVWHPDAERFVFAERNDLITESRLQPRRISGSTWVANGPDVLLPGRLVLNFSRSMDTHTTDPGGVLAKWHEITFAGDWICHVATRLFRTGALLGETSVPYSDPAIGDCRVPLQTLKARSRVSVRSR